MVGTFHAPTLGELSASEISRRWGSAVPETVKFPVTQEQQEVNGKEWFGNGRQMQDD
jgi:hypothetical protein